MVKVLVVGQTPPPYMGQAIMIGKILDHEYEKVKLYHVRMAFSKEIDEIGKFKIQKILHMFSIVFQIWYYRFRYNTKVLYYPPTGPNFVPLVRDIFILIHTRWLFSKTIFHYHAGGLSEYYKTLSSFWRFLSRLAYFKASASIRLSSLNPEDGKNLKVKKDYVIPYGIEDEFENFKQVQKPTNPIPQILFVGVHKASKGVLVLIEAAKVLKEQGFKFQINCMGKFETSEFKTQCESLIKQYELQDIVIFLGVQAGQNKFQTFHQTDIFCFPSFYESETFGVVLLEAMQFSLPIVTTKWRGIPSIVTDNENGFLVDIQNPLQTSEKLKLLLEDKELRIKMGNQGRQTFLEKYLLDTFHNNLQEVILEVVSS